MVVHRSQWVRGMGVRMPSGAMNKEQEDLIMCAYFIYFAGGIYLHIKMLSGGPFLQLLLHIMPSFIGQVIRRVALFSATQPVD